MSTTLLASFADGLAAVWTFLTGPISTAHWGNVVDFWLEQIFNDRFNVIYFLPLLPILMLLSGRRLRVGIIITCLIFLAYVFGVLYALLWLLTGLFLHALSERFSKECQRTDVLQIGPPLAAGAIITAWYVGTMVLHHVLLPAELNAWLFEHVRWIFPLGARGLAWEPNFYALDNAPASPGPPQLVHAMFWNAHSIGTAYLAVRMLHYFAELKRGSIPREQRTRLNFLSYVCYAPALIQGPIERFAPFHDQIETCHERRNVRNVIVGLGRIALGVSKSIIGTLYFQDVVFGELGAGPGGPYYTHPETIQSFWLLYFGVFLQVFWLYLEFSGYCDVAIGMARIIGYRQIENFRMPWIATSLRDFWRRWHISLSFILRDYVYIGLGGNRRHVLFNLVFTFVACGVWHALSFQAGLWGVAMGLMVTINHYWVRWMNHLDAQTQGWLPALRRRWIRLTPLPQICAWVVTMHALHFTLLILFGGAGVISVSAEIFRRIWLALAG